MTRNGTYLAPTMMAFQAVKRGAEQGRLTPHSSRKALEIYPHYRWERKPMAPPFAPDDE